MCPTHSHAPSGHTVEGRDHCLIYHGQISAEHKAWHTRPRLTALQVSQREIIVGPCCRVSGKNRTPAKFCSSSCQIMCTYTHTHTQSRSTPTTATIHRQTGVLASARAEGEREAVESILVNHKQRNVPGRTGDFRGRGPSRYTQESLHSVRQPFVRTEGDELVYPPGGRHGSFPRKKSFSK